MKKRSAVSAVMLGLAAFSAGCGDSVPDDAYVDFDQTAPSIPELHQSQPEPLKTPVQSKPDHGISPASSEKDLSTSGVTQALSKNETPDASRQTDTTGTETGERVPDASETASIGSEQLAAAPTDSGTAAPSPSSGTQALIQSSQSGLTGPVDNPIIENSASTEVRSIQLLIPEKHLRKERGTSALRVTYDDIDLLKVLNMEPVPADAVSHFPEWLKSLDGKPIRIRGFMYPTYQASGLTGFTLARDNGICCFVRQPKIYDIIGVTLADGVTTDYIEGRPFDVEGTFRIDPVADEKDLSRLYRIENARVLH